MTDVQRPRRIAVAVGLIAVLIEWLGFHWDVAWHADRGRDTFVTAPHMMISAGIAVAALTACVTIARTSLRARPGMTLLAFSGALMALGLAIDNWFHQQFGVDVAIWSPPHLMLALATLLGVLGVVADYARSPGSRPLFLCALAGVFFTVSTITLGEYEYGLPHFRMVLFPLAMAGLFGLAMVLSSATTALPWAGTVTAVVALVLRAVGVGLNHFLGRSLPTPPMGILAGAVVFDLARRRLRTGPAVALAWLVTVAVQAPWLRAVGKTWWVPSVAVAGAVLGIAAALVGAAIGRSAGALATGTRFRPRGGVLVAVAVAVVGVVGTGWGHLRLPESFRDATYSSNDDRLRLDVGGGTAADWVSVAGPSVPEGLFLTPPATPPEQPQGLTVIAGSFAPLVQGVRLRALRALPKLELSWLGGLTRAHGGYEGRVKGSGEWLAFWFVSGDHVWASVVERGSSGSVTMMRQGLRPPGTPPPWAEPVGTLGLVVLATIALLAAGRILGGDGDGHPPK
jgi:hypothetical protein